MKIKYFIYSLLLLTSTAVFGQKSAEFGGFVGRAYYLGEINPKTHWGKGFGSLTYGAALRYNLNMRYSLKASISHTKLNGEDEQTDFNFTQDRNAEFETSLTDFSGNIEFNFLPYAIGDKRNFFSPYLMVGFSYFIYNPSITVDGSEVPGQADERSSSLALAFGPGMKLNIGRKFSLGVEWGFRKTFIDDLEGLPNLKEDILEQGKDYDNDWYVLTGFSLTYKITNVGPCPMQNF